MLGASSSVAPGILHYFQSLNMNQRYLHFTLLSVLLSSCHTQPLETAYEGFTLICQDGPTLGYSPSSSINILHDGHHAFKDLNHNGVLDPYEDWRLDIESRAADLASQLSLEEIAGLMLYSDHQSIPGDGRSSVATYGGKTLAESDAEPWQLTDQQRDFFGRDHLRHVLVTSVQSTEVAVKWNNEAQAFVEGLGHGIPNNNSSDPRNGVSAAGNEFSAGAGGDISLWPNELGMGATFDPELVREYGQIASAEYRALGFATCLSPQIDLGTEPRWFRFQGTYSEDPQLVADMAEAYCDGFQTSTGKAALYGAWGFQSVNAMAKHWPGGGPCEAGRDAHFGRGKYAVYPGSNADRHKLPYRQGAFHLKNGTKQAAAIMPYYTISLGQSPDTVANNFNYDIITCQLREQEGYDGVVCTDWGVTADEVHPGSYSGKPWGVELLSVAQRHYLILKAGVDQFGGNNDPRPVLEAFEMLKNDIGEEAAEQRIRTSAHRLLRNIFRTGLFENPYMIAEESEKVVGCSEFMAKGYEAQQKSIVMVKNHGNTLPLAENQHKRVFIPRRYYPTHPSFWGSTIPADSITPVENKLVSQYFEIADSPEEADVAIVFIDSPFSGWGHSMREAMANADLSRIKPGLLAMARRYGRSIQEGQEDAFVSQYIQRFAQSEDNTFIPDPSQVSAPGNGYYPISLQYEDYVANDARLESLGQGDPFETIANRSYRGKGVHTYNHTDLELLQQTRLQMSGKPVILVVNTSNPFVMSEVEPLADAILLTFTIQNQAILDVISGRFEPSGLLPFQMPRDMKTVELQAEDVPLDMECYQDMDQHIYDFAFGMNWSGVINDQRVKRYKHLQ